jgi:hypothetical protein
MKKLLFATALFVISFQTTALCQGDNPVLKDVTSKLRNLLTDHITEKAYLHFDRPYPYYVAGDVIYFKAYVIKGERHEPTDISGMLHVDLINKDNVLLQSIVLQLNNGTGWGDFALPDTMQKGSYRIRAYTEWMRNEKVPNFFNQYISVSSATSVDRSVYADVAAGQPAMQFFPEGGNLVADIRSEVAFKAVGPTGMGMDVKGVVIDDDNKEVAKLASGHLGMGVFNFLPEQGKKYRARVTFANGVLETINLPAVEEKGITLAVNTVNPDKLSIEIKANRAYYKENLNKELNLLIYWAGALRTVTTKLDNEVLGLDMPAGNFRTGALTVTLLSQTGEPLNERMVFIQNPDLLNLSLNSNKPSYAKRENVRIGLNAKTQDGNAAAGSFSVSVVDESKISVDEDSENSILSYFLLTSDVKGYVEKPNYYFANITKETRADLDVLMLTQGFRRFVWKELLDNNNSIAAITYNPEQYLDISGTLKTKAGIPLVGASLILLPLAQTTTTDAEGRFRFAKVAFQSGTSFIVKMQSSPGKKSAVLTLDNSGQAPEVTAENITQGKYNANADILASLQNSQNKGILTASNESIVLKSDRVTSPKRYDNYRSSNLGGPGHADQVVSGDEIKNASSLSVGLSGLLHGVYFSSGQPVLNTGTIVSSAGEMVLPMLIVVDGVKMVGPGVSIDQYNPASIETIEVLKGPNASIYGIDGGAGVLVLTTRDADAPERINSKEMSPGIFSIKPHGYYKAREFYSPSYEAGRSGSRLPDTRTTIFWKPDVITDSSGNASFNFYNADGTGTYRVEVQGIDSKGNLGRQVYRYKVE